MNNMLAVLLGAGGGVASQALAALSGGKSGAKNVHGEGEDPFMAVLFDRMNAAQEGTAQFVAGSKPVLVSDADADADAGDEAQVVADGAKIPLAAALLQAQTSATDVVSQVVMGMPSAPGGNVVDGQKTVGDEGAGPAAGVDPLLGMLVGKGRAQGASSKTAPATLAAQMAANPKDGAAEAAAEGQLLPRGRAAEQPDLPVKQARTDILPAVSPATSTTVAQGLLIQSQGAAVETLGVASGTQTAQTMAAGMGHGLGAMGDMQGRSMAASPVSMSIEAPLRSPMFPQELGERIVWLSARQGQVADIALNPPHLGPLEVKLTLSGGEAGAQFFSPHAQVRDAIEAALPRLREMLAEAGVTLGQAQVRDESFQRQESLAQGDARSEMGQSDEDGLQADGSGVTPPMLGRTGQGLVDLYV